MIDDVLIAKYIDWAWDLVAPPHDLLSATDPPDIYAELAAQVLGGKASDYPIGTSPRNRAKSAYYRALYHGVPEAPWTYPALALVSIQHDKERSRALFRENLLRLEAPAKKASKLKPEVLDYAVGWVDDEIKNAVANGHPDNVLTWRSIRLQIEKLRRS